MNEQKMLDGWFGNGNPRPGGWIAGGGRGLRTASGTLEYHPPEVTVSWRGGGRHGTNDPKRMESP